MIKRIARAYNAVRSAFIEDLSIEDINKSKISFYEGFMTHRYDDTVVYIVAYKDYDNYVHWGPFSTMEHAQNWNNKLEKDFNMKAQVISVISPNSDPMLWILQ